VTIAVTPALHIAKKRDGLVLSNEEIRTFVNGFSAGTIPDYQMAAMAMAIYCRGMSVEETAALTDAMLASGARMQWKASGRPVVDKHSTGGIGDKTSLILAPLLACCGLAVPMISGRGLGATGGTLDKLEAIPGFHTDLNLSEIQAQVERVGCVITGASAEIAPADKKLYALRDVTATVPSIPLITASIMSKKLAETLDALVVDVKFGSGAFMKSLDQARKLAHSLVETGKRMGVKTAAILTDMNQPLGRLAGNLVEVHESINTLQGNGPADLWECTRELAAETLLLTKQTHSRLIAHKLLDAEISSGRAFAKFREMVAAQGGNLEQLPPMPTEGHEVTLDWAGFVHSIDTEWLGMAIIEMGGGRKIMSDKIDHSVGLEMLVRIGDRVEPAQPVVRVFCPVEKFEYVRSTIGSAFTMSEHPVPPRQLVVERIE
jgi:pyrimidine-nucleoside phosphorylase